MSYTFINGEQLTAAKVNDRLNHTLIGWQAFNPVWTASSTNPVVGNGTLAGRYTRIGKTVHCTIHLTAGSTTTFGSGFWSFKLPTASASPKWCPVGVAYVRDVSTTSNTRFLHVRLNSADTILASSADNSFLAGSVPFAWAASDFLSLSVTYEAA